MLKCRTDASVAALEPRTGVAYEEICAAARDLKADLIVLATHGYTGYKRVYPWQHSRARGPTSLPCPCSGGAPPRSDRSERRPAIGADRHRVPSSRRFLCRPIFSELFKNRVHLRRPATQLAISDAELRLVHVINPHCVPVWGQIRRARIQPSCMRGSGATRRRNKMRSIAATSQRPRPLVQVIHGSPGGPNLPRSESKTLISSSPPRTAAPGPCHLLIGSAAEHVSPPRALSRAGHSGTLQFENSQSAGAHMKSLESIAFICLCLIGSLVASKAAAAQSVNAATTPLTYANTVSFFKAAKFRATEVQPRCVIFFEGEWKSANVYSYGVIMVENSDEDIQVTFYLTDAHEMNWVTEFLDSQFFNRNETEKLFQLDERTERRARPKRRTLPRRFPSLAAAPRAASGVQLHARSWPSLGKLS